MTGPADDDKSARIRILVAIASYGTNNDRYLHQIIRQYRSMPFDIDIVVISNIEKGLGPDVECIVGLPSKNPWSLPFAHKKLFVERLNSYDLFVYSEDDILITEQNLCAWLDVSRQLLPDEIVGFLRIEIGVDGKVSYPDVHAHFHWDPLSVRRRGQYTLAHFTNEHAACYVLTRAQLGSALVSGGFDVAPHEGKYDLLCTAATDPYTQCGLKKLIPVSNLRAFTVHHMSNRYVGKMGVTADEFRKQIEALLRIAESGRRPKSLLPTETKLWRNAYSKDYYEPVRDVITSLIPNGVHSILSIGCGSGAIERSLIKKGLRVAAIPLDPIIAGAAAADGVEVLCEDLEQAGSTDERRFDCVLCLNILHLAPKPQKLLSLLHRYMRKDSILILQAPNMSSLRALRSHPREITRLARLNKYESTGVHFSSVRTIRNWCTRSGFQIQTQRRILASRDDGLLGFSSTVGQLLPKMLMSPLAVSIAVTATSARG
jgi:2-polyprenyl-3-methyl-5-hydroxy-6-metoxy-1,4-benzoquinol methylase